MWVHACVCVCVCVCVHVRMRVTTHVYASIGLCSVTGPVYVSEMAPSHIRGKLGLVNYFMTGGGVFIAAVAAGLFSIDSEHAYTFGWRFDKHKNYDIANWASLCDNVQGSCMDTVASA